MARRAGQRVQELLWQEGLGKLSEGEHERADTGVVLDLEAQVRVLMHFGEEVRVRALVEQPALALQLRGHGLVRLVKQAEAVEPRDAPDRAAAERDQREHELTQHGARIITSAEQCGARG